MTTVLLAVIAVLLLVHVIAAVAVAAAARGAFGSVRDSAQTLRDFMVAAGGVVGFKIGGNDGSDPEG